MKRILLLFFLVSVTSAISDKKEEARMPAFSITKDGLIVPPNCIRLRGNLFIEECEITNTHYLEYLHFLAGDSSLDKAAEAYPDTNLFGSVHKEAFIRHFNGFTRKPGSPHLIRGHLHHDTVLRTGKNGVNRYNYFSLHETRHFPLVGIHYDQALKYCAWKSKHVTDYFNHHLRKQKQYQLLGQKKVTFHYRLPTEAEWEEAASGGLSITRYPYGYHNLWVKPYVNYHSGVIKKMLDTNLTRSQIRKDIKKHLSSDTVLRIVCADRKVPYFDFPREEPEMVYFGGPNRLGLFNACGNVAEMVMEKGVAKGGSFKDRLGDCTIQSRQFYQKPEKWVGIRMVCEIIVQ